MNLQGPFLFLVGLLLVAGLGTATYRNIVYRIPLLPGAEQAVWQVEARIEYRALGAANHVYLTLPPEQNGFRVVSETGASSDFGFSLEDQEEQRRAHWTKRQALGEQVMFYKLELVEDADFSVPDPARPSRTLNPVPLDQPYSTAAIALVNDLLPITADANTLTQQIIREMNTDPMDQKISLLLDRYEPAQLLTILLTSANVSARTVQGLELMEGRRRQSLTTYVQVWEQDRWQLYDPATGLITHTDNLLLWQTDSPSVLDIVGGTDSRVSFSMISQTRAALTLAKERDTPLNISLYSLPIAEQGMFKLIMLMPIGALVVVFMRLVIGIRTSGTFMPVLIAMAFLQTELLPGIASLLLVVAVGLLLRSYLSALNLLLVARIATLVIMVIGIISVVSVLSYRLGLIGGLTITFFPMVILAWTIERMSIIWEEEGPREVLIQGGGSLLVATLAFLLMDQNPVSHLAFNFPELHLCVLALIMVLGRYTGYRVMELFRFSAFKAL
ncbi:MAG: inactive transglutaminase family protein [Proteobacteria bacterium]|nr:inactive transglutaminase family protein [Pseudomonadota bacterium]